MKRKVIIVIPTLNEAPNIARVLAELSCDLPSASDADFTFAVVDGGSTDGTQACVQGLARTRHDVLLLNNAARIQSAAVNLAVRQLGQSYNANDILVRCDAHAHYPAGFIHNLIATLDTTQADAVVVPMDSVGETCLQKAIAWVSDSRIGSGGSAHRGGHRSGEVDHGHHAAFRLASFCRAGGYDESFTHNEDAELDCRQRALGSRIFLDANIRLQYSPRASLSSLWRQYRAYGRGRSRTIRRHPHSWRLRQGLVPFNFLGCIAALLLACVLPTPLAWLLLCWPLLYLAALAGTSLALALRHRSLCGLWAGAAAWVMHSAWAIGFMDGLLRFSEAPWQARQQQALNPHVMTEGAL